MTPGNAGGLVGQSLGGYQLVSLLGAGGMAEVYHAQDLALGREVAVKVLPAWLAADPGYVERFRDEARRVATLNHPNVVPVYFHGEERGLLFLVMPLLKESLRDRMGREGRLPITDAARLVVQIAAGLDAAHSHGMVHRDVKPENILINSEGKALLTDFGIARDSSFLRQTGSNRTLAASGLPVGTPEYMAPEQLRAGVVDHRADIYALGAVLYELLAGVVPHDAPTPYEVAALVLTAPLTPPSAHNSEIWPELEHVVMTALASDPAARYQDTRSLAVALRRAVLHRDPKAASNPASSRANHQSLADAEPVAQFEGSATEDDLPADEGPAIQWPTLEAAPARHRRQPGRRTLVISVLLAVALVAACGVSGLAALGGMFPSGSATQTPLPLGRGLSNGVPGALATETATATPQSSATPWPTLTGTTPPVSGPSLTFNPISFVLTFNSSTGHCTGQQTITNNSDNAVNWFWTWPKKAPSSTAYTYTITRAGQSPYSGTQPPQDRNMPPRSSEVLTLSLTSAPLSQYKITVTDSQGGLYTFQLVVPAQCGGR